MSRVGKKPIEIPSGVEAKLETGKVTVKGPLGEISQNVNPKLTIKKEKQYACGRAAVKSENISRAARIDEKPGCQYGDRGKQGI